MVVCFALRQNIKAIPFVVMSGSFDVPLILNHFDQTTMASFRSQPIELEPHPDWSLALGA